VPDFVFEPIETVPFLPRDDKLTLVVAALATVTFAGMMPQSMTAASRNDRILFVKIFVLFFIVLIPFLDKMK